MPLPAGVVTAQVTGLNLTDLQGNTVTSGTVYFKASTVLADPTHDWFSPQYQVSTPVSAGVMTPVSLPANDQTVNPQNFTYEVRAELFFSSSGTQNPTPVVTDFFISLPHSPSTVDISALVSVAAFTAINGISVVGTGSIGQVLTNLGNNTANWQSPQASSTTFSRQQFIDMSGQSSSSVAPVGTWTPHYYLVTDTGNAFSGWLNMSDSTQNDAISFDFACGAGTYTIELRHLAFANRGIYTVQIDNVTVGTIDGYASSLTFTRSLLTGVVITAGRHTLTLVMATKNASSSAYYGFPERAVLTQTA